MEMKKARAVASFFHRSLLLESNASSLLPVHVAFGPVGKMSKVVFPAVGPGLGTSLHR
jgi:hypothetical protein